MSKTIVIVPTCERDKWFSDLAVEGIRTFWPEVMVMELLDTDKSTETDVPDDIRDIVRKVPYLRKQIDAPFIVDCDRIVLLDADCFMFAKPDELVNQYAYMGHTLYGNHDYQWGTKVWASLGHFFPKTEPLFCAGCFSAPRTMWTYNRELMFDYLRQCMKLGYGKWDWDFHPVTFDQNLNAGLWRKTCRDNPLPALEYPLGIPTMDMKIFHACYFRRRPEFKQFLVDYRRHIERYS